MINYENSQSRNFEQFPSCERELSAEKALRCLVAEELGFGGSVVGLLPTKVIVEQDILNWKNIATFTGSQKEMEFIFNVAAHHIVLMNDKTNQGAIVGKAMDFITTTISNKKISDVSRYVATMSSFLMGRTSASIALLFAAGITDLETMKAAATISLEDLVISVELHRKTGASLTEIIKEIVPCP